MNAKKNRGLVVHYVHTKPSIKQAFRSIYLPYIQMLSVLCIYKYLTEKVFVILE